MKIILILVLSLSLGSCTDTFTLSLCEGGVDYTKEFEGDYFLSSKEEESPLALSFDEKKNVLKNENGKEIRVCKLGFEESSNEFYFEIKEPGRVGFWLNKVLLNENGGEVTVSHTTGFDIDKVDDFGISFFQEMWHGTINKEYFVIHNKPEDTEFLVKEAALYSKEKTYVFRKTSI